MEKKYNEDNLFYNNLQEQLRLKNNENHNINKTLKLQIQFLNKYFNFYILIKFLFGFIFLTLPYILFLYLFYNKKNLEGSSRFIIIGYFITLSLTGAIVILLIVFKIGDSFKTYGFFFRPWELKYILRLINLFFIIIFSLFFFYSIESFYSDICLIKETIEQNSKSSKIFDKGSYILRYLFIFSFWNTEKDSKGMYIHQKMEYFEYEQSFDDFRGIFNPFFYPFIYLLSYLFLRLIVFKIKYLWLNLCIIICGLFECFYFIFFPIKDSKNNNTLFKSNQRIYFEKDYKLISLEFIPLIILIISFMIYGYIETINKLINKTLYSRKNYKFSVFVLIISVLSFICLLIGYGIILFFIIYSIFFLKVDIDMPIEIFFNFWKLLMISILLISIGNSFPFGNYFFKLLYRSIEYEIYDHPIKKNYYIKTSYNLKDKKAKNKKRKKLFSE